MNKLAHFFLGVVITLLVLVSVVLVLVFTNPRFKQSMTSIFSKYSAGFEYADHDKFNSPAEQNGLEGTAIYFHCDKSTISQYDEQYSYFIASDNGNNWLVLTGNMENVKGIELAVKSATDIWVYGQYIGYSSVQSCPAVVATQLIIDGTVYPLNISRFK